MDKFKDQIVLLGRNTVHDALLSDKVITKVVIAGNVEFDKTIKEIEKLARDKKVPVSVIAEKKFGFFGDQGASQGVAALMQEAQSSTISQISKAKENTVFLLYNHLDYEQNLGSILRTAWAAEVSAVICAPNGVHKITPVVSKVSMGAAAYVPVIAQSLFQTIDTLKRQTIPVVGVEVGRGEEYTKQNLTGPVAFLFGGEAKGISDPLTKHCDLFVHIPIQQKVASLNVSIATAIVLFEKLRQERA